jgi:uncharacterized coiled-coil protein SlyX
LSRQKRFSQQLTRSTAHDLPAIALSKSMELEARIARLEQLVKELGASVLMLSRQSAATQAQLDHLIARLGHRLDRL